MDLLTSVKEAVVEVVWKGWCKGCSVAGGRAKRPEGETQQRLILGAPAVQGP